MAFTMSRLDHFVGRPMRPGPEYVGTRSAMRSHSSSVKSPCVDRQAFELAPREAPIWRVYANSSPDTLKFDPQSAVLFPTASKDVRNVLELSLQRTATRLGTNS